MKRALDLREALRALGSPAKAQASGRFFKTGPGQYGEGDIFLGVTVPAQRLVAKRHLTLKVDEVENLLHSPEHEFRMTALLIWTYQFAKGNEATRRVIYQFYIANTKWVNNWDLVDCSAPRIVGGWLQDYDRGILDHLAQSEILWERRIAMVATLNFIVLGEADDALRIAGTLVNDREDLIQKAAGWMLREVGKHCGESVLVEWLATRYQTMPRTMLRYAIERFAPGVRAAYLKK